MTDLKLLEDKILQANDAGDYDTVELLKDEYARQSKAAAARVPRAVAPAGAVGAPDRGGSTSTGADIPSLRTGAAVAGMAPARALSGIVDLGIAGGAAFDKAIGQLPPDFQPPYLSPQVSRLTDELAGKPVPNSVGRAAFEGAITAPLSGARTLAGLVPAAVSGSAAGAAGQYAAERGLPGWAQIAASMLAAQTGRLPGLRGLTTQEALAAGKIKPALEGITEDSLNRGALAHTEARGQGVQLLPSQAIPEEAAALQRLQAQLLASKAKNADGFRAYMGALPEKVREMVRQLTNSGGQAPRNDDLLAGDIQDVAKDVLKSGTKAVNDATKPLYNSNTATGWQFKPQVVQQVEAGFNQLMTQNRSQGNVVAALGEARDRLLNLLRQGKVTPEELTNRLAEVKNTLPSYAAPGLSPQDGQRLRAVVLDAVKPLEAMIGKHAPTIPEAQALQGSLRSVLPDQFSDFTRQAKTGGGPGTAIDAAMKKPEMIAELARRAPQVAQETLQRTVNQAVEKALATDPNTNLPRSAGPISAKVALTEGATGTTLQQNLPTLFRNAPDPAAAAEGFNRILRTVANASKNPGVTTAATADPIAGAARLTGGSYAQKISEAGRQASGFVGRIRDNATIAILTRPDVMERLIYLSKVPTPQITVPAIMAAVPQLFQEVQDGTR